MVRLNQKISGVSLVESMIAMVIISVVFLISVQIFTQVQASSQNIAKLEASQLLEDQWYKSKSVPPLVSESIEIDGRLTVTQEVELVQPHLYRVNLSCHNMKDEMLASKIYYLHE